MFSCPNCGRCYMTTGKRLNLTKDSQKRMDELVKAWAREGVMLCCQINYDEWRIKGINGDYGKTD